MLKLSDEQRAAFARAVTVARETPALDGAIARLYADFESERARREPRCDRSGRCCRFESYGHRLFVTTAEVAWFAGQLATAGVRPVDPWDGTGCPYQMRGLCGAHAARPFGCRVYFCDPTAREWQEETYERFQARLRELHDRLDVPYLYVEWREALAALGLDRPADGSAGLKLPVLGSR